MDLVAVLPAELSQPKLERILDRIEARGWSGESSRGNEQVVLTVSGAAHEAELEAVLPAGIDADVFELRRRRDYSLARHRLTLLTWMVRAVVLLAVGLVAIPVVGYLAPPNGAETVPDLVRVASVDRLEPGTARLVRLAGRPVLAIHLEGRRYFALGATCSYVEECVLEWSEERRQVVCPCHGDVFDVYGNVLEGPSAIPLRRYVIERFGNDLFVGRED